MIYLVSQVPRQCWAWVLRFPIGLTHTLYSPNTLALHGLYTLYMYILSRMSYLCSHSANILLDSRLVPKLSDFGLARECSARTTQQSRYSTKSEVIMGTVAYMAPEFFRNRRLSPKMDVYSFGVVLLELFTGLAADDPTAPQRTLVRESFCH